MSLPVPALPASDAQVAAFVRDLGVPGLADVHVHFLPERVLAKVRSYFDAAGTHYGRDWPLVYRGDEDERLGTLARLGVSTFTSLVYAHKPGMSAWLNDWSLDFAARVPACVPTATFYPEDGVTTYVASALERGARVMKLHLQVGDYDPRDSRLDDVWGMCQEAGTVLVVHCASGPLPGRFTGPGPISDVLGRFPRLRMVVAHLGMPEYEDFIHLAETRESVYLDTTMAGTDFVERTTPLPAALRPRIRSLTRDGKVVLGSDFPNVPYPYAHQLEALPRLGIDDADLLAQVVWRTGSALMSP
jgi:uncharacterized protein